MRINNFFKLFFKVKKVNNEEIKKIIFPDGVIIRLYDERSEENQNDRYKYKSNVINAVKIKLIYIGIIGYYNIYTYIEGIYPSRIKLNRRIRINYPMQIVYK